MAAGDVTITVIGNLTDDPELRFTPSGAAVAKFRIASTPRILDRQTNEWKDGEPLFLACNIWRQAAEYATAKVQKMQRSSGGGGFGASGGGGGGNAPSGGNGGGFDDPWASAAPAASSGSFDEEPPF